MGGANLLNQGGGLFQVTLEVSALMRNVAGEFARAYHRRKKRVNAFWGDNFHGTLADTCGGAFVT